MANPKWLTTAGNLGVIPELTYYEYALDAYDSGGGTITYSLVSGKMPKGLQVITTGKIQGIPISELTGDVNVEYRFTVRARIASGAVADRTFTITISNILPPRITPRNVDLGTYFDGVYVDTQLDTLPETPGEVLKWKLKQGELPAGLSLDANGKLTGYLQPVPVVGPGSLPGWDRTSWDLLYQGQRLGWDFPTDVTVKTYEFTIEVFDGVHYDQSTYQLTVFPRQDLLASSTEIITDSGGNTLTADNTTIRSSYDLITASTTTQPITVTETDKHYPIINTTQADLVAVRQDSYYAFRFTATDLDEDVLKWAIPTIDGSGFDETGIGYDVSYFSATELTIPGGQIIATPTYTATGSSGTTFKVSSTAGLYPGLLVTMASGLGGNRTITEVVDATTLTLSQAPSGTPTDGDTVTVTAATQLVLNEDSGWLIGRLPIQTADEVEYEFEVQVYKRDDPTYVTTKLFTLTVYGDLNDTIDWTTASDLGTIENGEISTLNVQATSRTGKTLYYTLTADRRQKLPQGLQMNASGLIYGRVAFPMFGLDQGTTTIDARLGTTTFDNNFTFTVTAADALGTVASTRTFTIKVVDRNKEPYENLYLKALPTQKQREEFLDIINNSDIFDPTQIYRNTDPWFGVSKEIKFLFLPGLEASKLETYANAIATNHFEQRLTFGDVKTAVALDAKFNTKYEVVYLEIKDSASNSAGGSAGNTKILTNTITNPYYDVDGNEYKTAYPTGFQNMTDRVTDTISYANRGALPEWMTSNQPVTGTNRFTEPLGFTKGVVLAYTKPGASKKMAYKLNKQNYDFNEIDFSVDRYQLDNIYSQYYDIANSKWNKSSETTFDKQLAVGNTYQVKSQVDYAVTGVGFSRIHNRHVNFIRANGGIDGVTDFNDGELLIFAQQEFHFPFDDLDHKTNYEEDYNHGWQKVTTIWSSLEDSWDSDEGTATLLDDLRWDAAEYVPGYLEFITSGVTNQRAGVWKININAESIVTLTFETAIVYRDSVTVRTGDSYGGRKLFFDPVAGTTIDPLLGTYRSFPAWTQIPQVLQTEDARTTYDQNGTRFFTNRDQPVIPGEGDKYIKFTKTGVFV